MSSLARHEGYFLLDHSDSPGLPGSILLANDLPYHIGKARWESATFTCSHCEAQVIKHKHRTRGRGYCRKCDHYLCDGCEAERVKTGLCRPFKSIVQDYLELVDRGVEPLVAVQTVLFVP